MNRLKDLREENDLFQKDIARIINVNQTTYSRYESEIIPLQLDILIKLADYYNTSIDYILFRTDQRESYPKSIISE